MDIFVVLQANYTIIFESIQIRRTRAELEATCTKHKVIGAKYRGRVSIAEISQPAKFSQPAVFSCVDHFLIAFYGFVPKLPLMYFCCFIHFCNFLDSEQYISLSQAL